MRPDVERDLSASARAFKEAVWPRIKGLVQGGEIMPVEGTTSDDLKSSLDMLAGIDAWQICHGQGRMRGIASRVQHYDFDTFTIRYKRDSGGATEYAKRLHAMQHVDEGWLLPHLTIQAYTRDAELRDLRAVGIVRTRDLYLHVEEHLEEAEGGDEAAIYIRRTRERGPSGATFIVAPWSCLLSHGVKLKMWRASRSSGCSTPHACTPRPRSSRRASTPTWA